MSSFILRTAKNDLLQNWVRVNAAGSLKQKPQDSWRAYLIANGGVGSTLNDLERSFLAAAGVNMSTYKTLNDAWTAYLAALPVSGGKGGEKVRNKYK